MYPPCTPDGDLYTSMIETQHPRTGSLLTIQLCQRIGIDTLGQYRLFVLRCPTCLFDRFDNCSAWSLGCWIEHSSVYPVDALCFG